MREFILLLVVILSTGVLKANAAPPDSHPAIAIVTSIQADACVEREGRCQKIKKGATLYPNDRLIIHSGEVVLYLIQDRARETLSKGSHLIEIDDYRLDSNTYVATRLQQLLYAEPRKTASTNVRGENRQNCPGSHPFQSPPPWLAACLANSANSASISATSDSDDRILPLAQFSHYREWPGAIMANASHPGIFLATGESCSALVDQSDDITLSKAQLVYIIDRRQEAYLVYGMQQLSEPCQNQLDAEVKVVKDSGLLKGVDLYIALQALYLEYDLKFEAAELLRQATLIGNPG
jgi:hypothetical protein